MGKDSCGARNYGIDMLRCVSMMMVVVLHTLNRGGALSAATAGSAEAAVGWLLESACYGAVDAYAIISGYVGWNRKWRPSRALSVWVETLFYAVLAATVFLPTGLYEVSGEALKYSFFPIFTGHYWYMTSYVALMVTAPFLNRGIANATKREAAVFAAASLVIFMTVPRAANLSVFGLDGGYSALWLMICYIFGGLMSRFDVGKNIPNAALLLIYAASVAATFAVKMAGSSMLLSYISPTVFIGSASLCAMFSKLKIGKICAALIGAFAPASLGVYIIHVNYFVWRMYFDGYARCFAGGGVLRYAALVLASSFVIYIALSLCDIARIQLFRLARGDRLMSYIDKAVMRGE